jgi:quercetin dioxygenase-like cupin family protein
MKEDRRGAIDGPGSWIGGAALADRGGGTRQQRREMIAERIDQLELLEVWYENDPTMRLKVNFPYFLGTGTKSTAVVYFEIEPGYKLGTHTDSAEEILLILEWTAEVSLGDEQGRLSAGEMALVPAMVPHGLRNVGEETVRVVGFFSSNVVVSTFDQPMMPFNQRVLGTPPVLEDEEVPTGEVST